MSDLILSIEDALVIIAGKPFFEGLTFHIHKGRKIALVGKNGAGKTTLMNLITGDREIDDGSRWMFAGISIGYMQQNVTPIPGQTIHDYVFSGLTQIQDWDQSYKVDMILSPLGLNPSDHMDRLSGGFLRRATLAKALVEEPDILLLDEPTNHMDLETIEWLENYLKYYAGAVLCVSHDRTFLANITDRVFWLDRGKLKVSPRGFSSFEEWSKELLDQERRQLHNREKKVELEMEWANRGVKARVKRNVRRVAQAHEARAQLEADQKAFRRATKTIKLPPVETEDSSHNIVEFFNVHKHYGSKTILDKFSFKIRRRDRIGILGKNGSGKTSFLKMLIGEISPDSGKIKMAKDLTFGYFDQKRSTLDLTKTLQDNLCSEGSDHLDVRGKYRHVCGYLKDFLFEPEDAWRKVSTLSGGQMNRLMLAKVLANPGSFLILDEPTNDLDMDTLDMLEAILDAYDGTLVVVSHDRDFLDQTIDKLLVFEGDGRIETIIGGYTDYINFKTSKRPDILSAVDKTSKIKSKENAVPDKPPVIKQTTKLTYKEQYEFDKLPQKIKDLEQECRTLEETLADPGLYMRDSDLFMKYSKKLPKIRAELQAAETRWLELDALHSQIASGT